MMQSKGIRAWLPAAPHEALGLNRLGAMPKKPTHLELLHAGTARSRRALHLGPPDPLPQGGQITRHSLSMFHCHGSQQQ